MIKEIIKNKRLTCWIILSIVLMIYFLGYYGSISILTKVMMGLAASATVLAILTYSIKTHVSMLLLFVNQLFNLAISMLIKSEKNTDSLGNSLLKLNYITPEFFITLVGVLSAVYMSVRAVHKSGLYLNLENIIKIDLYPYRVSAMTNVLIVSIIGSIIMILAGSIEGIIQSNSILPTAVVVLPSIILLTSVIPVEITSYIRIVYYLLWIYVIYMMVNINGYGVANLTEPVIYLVAVVVDFRCSDKRKGSNEI